MVAVNQVKSKTETPKEPETVNLELANVKRYYYANTLYVSGQVYVFAAEVARHMLALKDTRGNAAFMLAKPRTRMVQIPVEQREVKIKRVDRVLTDVASFLTQKDLEPLGRIELGDDDPEIAEKLQRVDAGAQELDTAQDDGAVTV